MKHETILRAFCIGLCCIQSASAYMVPKPVALDKLTFDSDLVFKGTAISTEPVEDDWFKPCPGFAERDVCILSGCIEQHAFPPLFCGEAAIVE